MQRFSFTFTNDDDKVVSYVGEGDILDLFNEFERVLKEEQEIDNSVTIELLDDEAKEQLGW